jgi:hypothetical protein
MFKSFQSTKQKHDVNVHLTMSIVHENKVKVRWLTKIHHDQTVDQI